MGEAVPVCCRIEAHPEESVVHTRRNLFRGPVVVAQSQRFHDGFCDTPSRIQRIEWILEYQSGLATQRFRGLLAQNLTSIAYVTGIGIF